MCCNEKSMLKTIVVVWFNVLVRFWRIFSVVFLSKEVFADLVSVKLKYHRRIAVIGCVLVTILLSLTLLFTERINFEITHLQPQLTFEITRIKQAHDEGDVEVDEAYACSPETTNRMKTRVQNVKRLCQLHHLGQFRHADGKNDLGVKDPPTPQYSYFFMNREARLAWCPVYKAGSTSWLHNMMLMAGVPEAELVKSRKQLSSWAREIYGEPQPGTDFDSSLKLLIVRHPFSRILSAYRDKLSNPMSIGQEQGTPHFYSKYGQLIVKKFRKDDRIRQKEPTFPEFVEYLINTDIVQYSDDHWLPVYYSCTPCRVQYDFIAKVETFNRDQVCIIKETEHVRALPILKPKWKHRAIATGLKGRESLAAKYFSELTKLQIRKLYQKYELDFNLFGYSYSEYLQFADGE